MVARTAFYSGFGNWRSRHQCKDIPLRRYQCPNGPEYKSFLVIQGQPITVMQLADLSLYKATPEQKIVSRRNTHTFWSKDSSIEQYLFRESFLETCQYAADGRMTIWQVMTSNYGTCNCIIIFL
jgi:hypothetical protein